MTERQAPLHLSLSSVSENKEVLASDNIAQYQSSVTDNFMPPSIVQSNSGYLHSTNESNTQWMLEYNMRQNNDDDRRGSRSSAQGFQGTQSAAKEFDCMLVWDDKSQSYVLDRLSSAFTFKYDRGHSKLSEAAKKGLSGSAPTIKHQLLERRTSGLGLELTDPNQIASNSSKLEEHQMATGQEEQVLDDGVVDDDDDSFVRQLELGLEGFTTDEPGKDSSMEERDSPSPSHAKTGLGILQEMRESNITPRGSPYIDRPKGRQETFKTALGENRSLMSSQVAATNTARSTPVLSPPSLANSPRPTGFDSTLPNSSSWKPPPQRSNVAIAYDDDDEEGDDESDDDEEDGEEDEEEDDEDFDSFARQLESSLQG